MSNSPPPIIIGSISDLNIPEQKSQETEDERKLREQKERREAQQAAHEKLMNKVNVDRKETQSKELQEAEKRKKDNEALAIKTRQEFERKKEQERQDQARKERLLREAEEKKIMEEEKAYQLRLSKRPKQMKMSKFHYGTSDVNTIKIQFKTTDNDNIYELSINKNEPIKTLIKYIKHIISYIFDIQLIINGNELDCNLNIRIDYCGIKNDDMIIVNKIPNDDRTIMNDIYQKIISKNYDLSILNLYDTVFIKEFIIFIDKLKRKSVV